jgi:hypothetical protein
VPKHRGAGGQLRMIISGDRPRTPLKAASVMLASSHLERPSNLEFEVGGFL